MKKEFFSGFAGALVAVVIGHYSQVHLFEMQKKTRYKETLYLKVGSVNSKIEKGLIEIYKFQESLGIAYSKGESQKVFDSYMDINDKIIDLNSIIKSLRFEMSNMGISSGVDELGDILNSFESIRTQYKSILDKVETEKGREELLASHRAFLRNRNNISKYLDKLFNTHIKVED
tara:strand:- start:84 stop:605 length:522 start_codon:yes stop_codon:yes gene_type:complete